jgi:hypothetical protein
MRDVSTERWTHKDSKRPDPVEVGRGGGDVGDGDAQSVFIKGDNKWRDAAYVYLQARFGQATREKHQFVRVSETLTPDDVMVNTVNKTQCFLLSLWPISGL